MDKISAHVSHFIIDNGLCFTYTRGEIEMLYGELVEIHSREVYGVTVDAFCKEIIADTNVEFFLRMVIEYYLSSINRWDPVPLSAYEATMRAFANLLRLEVAQAESATCGVRNSALLLAEKLQHTVDNM